jgi:hypothetical protein
VGQFTVPKKAYSRFSHYSIDSSGQAPVAEAAVGQLIGPGNCFIPGHAAIGIIARGFCIIGILQPGYVQHVVLNHAIAAIKERGLGHGACNSKQGKDSVEASFTYSRLPFFCLYVHVENYHFKLHGLNGPCGE